MEQGIQSRGSKFDENYSLRWVSSAWTSTIYADFLSRSLAGCDGNDLLQMAMEKFLNMRRRWPRGLEPLKALFGAMRSISSNELKKETNGPIDTFAVVSTTDESPDEGQQPYAVATTLETPEDVLIGRQLVEQIEAELSDDEEAGLLFMFWIEGTRGAEAAAELGWDQKRFDAARKRLLRRLAPHDRQG
ncbi:sigma-70 family RNA polymerase sigma factor [Burkholderia vietnamiensis]|nr:sigma-70 family RNA polymerase sigma factor [Burkholderia vietnamiensis]